MIKKIIARWLGIKPARLRDGDVHWVVNDNAELGVKIGEQMFFLYKGESIDYGKNAKHDSGHDMLYRPVYKREFGECCHPVHLKQIPKSYTEGNGWIKM